METREPSQNNSKIITKTFHRERRVTLVRILASLYIILLLSTGLPLETKAAETSTGYLDEKSNRTMVPLRFISEELGANVNWNGQTRVVTIGKDATKITIKIGESHANVNGKLEPLDASAVVKSGSTYVPVRFVSEMLKANVKWKGDESTVVITDKDKVINLFVLRGNPISLTKKNVKVGSKTLTANVVKIDLKHPSIKMKVALAKGQVGQVEDLASIAKRHGAAVAINGTFFDAYTAVTEPYGIIVSDGKPVHVGRGKTVFGFDKNNQVSFDLVNPRIDGTINNSLAYRDSWYAYWLNRTPSKNGNSINIFTPERGTEIGFSYGKNVVVENGYVTAIQTGNVSIPKTGYVINFTGNLQNSLLPRFEVGKAVGYSVQMQPETGELAFWNGVEGALGVGPRLVTNGIVTVNALEEGFTEAKILTQAAARSAVGVTKNHHLLLVTTTATMNDLGELMKKLGAIQAMNLDGGASSGLYVNGNYVSRTGREISNALLIFEK